MPGGIEALPLFDAPSSGTHQVASQQEASAVPPASLSASSRDLEQHNGEHHTFAFHAIGNPGNLLRDAYELLSPTHSIDSDELGDHRQAIDDHHARMRRAAEFERAAAELREIRRQAGVQRRRIERALRAAERAEQQETRRQAGGMYVGEKRAPSRPCHANVDPADWDVLKRVALHRRLPVGQLAGSVVIAAAERRRPLHPQHDRGAVSRRFIRLLGVGDDAWVAFRLRAVESGLSVADALGAVFAAEARRLKPNTPDPT